MKVLGSNLAGDVIVQFTKGEADALNAVRRTMKGLYYRWKGLGDIDDEDTMEDVFYLMIQFAKTRGCLREFEMAVRHLKDELLTLKGRNDDKDL